MDNKKTEKNASDNATIGSNERGKIEKKLIETQQSLKVFIEGIPESVFLMDLDGTILEANSTFAKRLGLYPKNTVGLCVYDLVDKELALKRKEYVNTVISTKTPLRIEDMRGDKTIENNLYPVLNENNEISHVIVIGFDITDQKKFQQLLKESEDKYRELYNNMSTCVAIYEATNQGEDFIFKGLNRAGEEKSKVKLEEIMDKSVVEVFPSVIEIGLFDIFKRVYKTGKPEYLPTVLYKDNKMSQWVENYVYKLPSGEVVAVYDDVSKTKKAEEQLKNSEEKFRTFFERNPSYSYIMSPEGSFIDLNQAALNALGYEKNELLGKHRSVIYPPESLPKMREIFDELEKTGYIKDKEVTIITKNGEKRVVLISSLKVMDKNGNWISSISMHNDITERKKAEEALRESEEKYRLLVKNAGVGIGYHDLDCKILMYNDIAASHLGGKPEDFIGKYLDEIFDKESASIYNNRIKSAIESGKELIFEDLVELPSGNKYFVSHHCPIKNENGKLVGVQIIAQDLSEQKKVEIALRESEEKFRSIFEATADIITYTDWHGNILDTNSKVKDILGYEREEIIGKNIRDLKLIDIEELPRILKLFIKTISSGRALDKTELALRNNKGDKVYFEIATQFIKKDKKVIGAVSIFRDITERKKMVEALRESEEKFRSIFDSAQDAIFIINKEDRLIDANKKASKVFGYTKEEFLLLKIPDLQAPEVRGTPGTVIKSELEKYKWNTFEALDVDKFGNKISVEISQSLFNLKGEEVILNIVRDISKRKKMEDRIKDSEMHYRSLFENSPIAMWEEDYSLVKKEIDELKKSGTNDIRRYLENNIDFVKKCVPLVKIIDFNQSVLKLYNAKDKKAYLNNLSNVFSESSFNMFKEAMICIAEGKTYLFGEDKNYTIDGKELEVIVTWSVVPGHENNYDKVYVSDLDITYQKRAQETIKESEEKYRNIVNTANEGIWAMDKNYLTTFVNPKMSEMIGYTPEEMIGKRVDYFMFKEDLEDHSDKMKSRSRGIDQIYERRFRKKNGEELWTVVSATPLMDNSGDFKGSFAMFTDITERKKIENKLKESEEKYRSFVENANEGIWVVDDHYLTTLVNSKMAYMLGYTVEEMMGKSAGIFLYDKDIGTQVNRMAARTEGLQQSYELALRKKDGSKLWAFVSATPLIDEKGKFKGSFAMFTDISERKRNEEIIKDLNDNLKLLNKILRHDISNDLTVISIALELIETEDKEMVNKAFNAVQRSVDLIEKIRCLESAMVTKYKLKPISTKLVLNFIKKTYTDMPIKVTGECKIMADEALNSVFDNIINNAIIHGKTDKIDIEISSENNICQIKIIDYGIGIPDKIKNRIFEEEFSYGNKGGSGLGLYIVKKTIERYGGSIKVEDTRPHGATFIINLETCIC